MAHAVTHDRSDRKRERGPKRARQTLLGKKLGAPERTSTPPQTASPLVPPAPGPDERRAMIAEAAYYRAERRGFERGYELDDWLQAERDIERALPGRDDDTPSRCGD
jgi:hypothetical protein